MVRFLDIKIEECDKLPTTLCQPCTSKMEELQCFYHHCQDAQKILAVQHGVQLQDERVIENQALVASNENNITDEVVKEDTTDAIPFTTTTTSTTTLSADKLLETAIKDTCILSGEDSEESGEDSEESLSDDENQTDDQSATEDKVCV